MAEAPAYIQTTITSTRIRFARNLSMYPFPERMNKKQAREIIFLVKQALTGVDYFIQKDIDLLSKEEATLFQEHHLISPALLKHKDIASVFFTEDKSISIMVNEEDHLREQYIYNGFDLYKAYEQIGGIDEVLSSTLDFAYNEKLGYLTACPSNLGTGMRASVMMFLPGLATSGELKNYLPTLKAGGLTVRGVFGEGSKAEGYSFQISNERTLGIAEREIIEQVMRTIMTLCDLEIRAREKLLKENKLAYKDKCLRSYGLLSNCAMLTLNELTEGIVNLKLGIALGFFKPRKMQEFNDFLADMRPASFRLDTGLTLATEEECNIARADIMRRMLPELLIKTDLF